jgi:diguanylate cyclase (GGDEF)-like protein
LSDGKERIREIYEDSLKGHFLVSSTPLYDSHQKPYGVVEVARDITELKKLEEKLQRAVITDELTGLHNRRGFTILSEQQLNVASRDNRMLTLLYADLDNMKQINDNFGHAAGDTALVDAAHILRNSFRKSDVIGRIGGDEFAVLLAGGAHDDTVIIGHLHNNVRMFNERNKRSYELSLSLGIAHYDPEHAYTLDALLDRADSAMYEQKNLRRKSRG